MADDLLLDQPTNEQWAKIDAAESNGVYTLNVTTGAPTAALLLPQPNGTWFKLGTVLTDGVHMLCVKQG